MRIDGKALAKACGAGDSKVATHLCRAQLNEFERLADEYEDLVVACTQEAPLFLETADELGETAPSLRFVNIRERAGWSKDAETKKGSATITAKMAALLSEAALDIPAAGSVTLASSGTLLILGDGETAIDAAKRVAHRLDVTVILSGEAAVLPPALMEVPVFQGRVTSAEGHLGAFRVTVEDFAPARPSSKDRLDFDDDARTGASVCDLILDLRGGTPLFPAPEKRDGYFNPDPDRPAAVAEALLELTDMVGEFEKPRYVDYEASICAHSRSGITGCTRCIDTCPTGAITPDGDKVAFDPYICAGCGSCASVCPTGAAKYTLPDGDALYERLAAVLGTYLKAGGEDPVLLVHDEEWGSEMISAMSRSGGGLPANVMPFALNSATQTGLEFLLTAGAFGAERVLTLLGPAKADEKEGLEGEMRLADAVFAGLGYGDGRLAIVEEPDPQALEAYLYGLDGRPGMPGGTFRAMGRKRSVMALALNHLHKHAPQPVDELALPDGAPFGAVDVDIAGCTLCLSCVGACPTGALKDNEDRPQLSFAEDACVQCGLCRNTCPEKVISPRPRLSFSEDARSHQVIKEEEPFECIRCGKPFAARSSIDVLMDKLKDHPMFSGEGGLERLKMCEDCRVIALAEEDEQPLAGTERPVPRTTDDYLREREELRRQAEQDMKEKGLLPPDSEK